MSRTIVCGDIHGAYKALIQCFERSNFDYENDTLIQLGDVADGWSEVYECVDKLLSIKNLISIKGNHDAVFLQWMNTGIHPWYWLQGGIGTLNSYIKHSERTISISHSIGGYKTTLTNVDIPETHLKFFKNQLIKYIDSNNKIFVHGGFDRWENISNQTESTLIWDRELWNQALSCKQGKLQTVNDFKEIYIGHTTTMNWGKDYPMNSGGVYNLDTGAGFNGRLTFMDINTKEIWQSDNVKELYPNEEGR